MAREICLRQLAVRPRTRAELATALRQRAASPTRSAAEVLDRYDEVGMIDDAAFARAWVASRHHGRGLARRALANELRRKGVDSETVGEALDELDDDTEAATARALVDRKLRTTRRRAGRGLPPAGGHAGAQGLPAGVAIRAVKEALAAQSAEAAEFAEQVDADALAEARGPRSRRRVGPAAPSRPTSRRTLRADRGGGTHGARAERARRHRPRCWRARRARRTAWPAPAGRCAGRPGRARAALCAGR